MSLFLIDHSVWARRGNTQVEECLNLVRLRHQVVTATPQLLEAGFSARSPDEWDVTIAAFGKLRPLTMSATTHTIALEVQRALWHGGLVRAAGAFDTLLAAIAIEHDAIVLHYDADFELIATEEPRLRQQWVAPRGSLS